MTSSEVRRLSNATVTASRLSDVDKSFVGAVYDDSGLLVRASVRRVDRSDPWRSNDPERIDIGQRVVGKYNIDGADMYLERAIFGGYIFGGWGHTLVETVASAWAATEVDPDAPLLVAPWGRVWPISVSRAIDLLRFAGWGDRQIIVSAGKTEISDLWAPNILVDLDDLRFGSQTLDPRLRRVHEAIRSASLVGSDHSTQNCVSEKLFLARPVSHRRAHPDEMAIEGRFRDLGFEVLRGWDVSVKDQVRLVAQSSEIVGFSGSNLHNSAFGDGHLKVVELVDERGEDFGDTSLQTALCRSARQKYLRIPTFVDGEPLSASAVERAYLEHIAHD